ncbi:SprT family protein [Weissella viridescens]|uniref:SprT family protein n=1 Tax=Weissella viridescens TaxID=1629 RepID=A0A3P2RD36_WEIVI|nr:SprT family protein [Weissella viridescens]RRG18504.1 SprT family protein [Weissella viridescens]
MTDEELQSLVEQISLSDFERPFAHRAIFNRRLRSTGGRYLLATHNIEINLKMLTDFDDETLRGVIQHELIHYHMHTQGLPHQHRDRAFKEELARTGALRFAPAKPETAKWHYQCANGHDIYRNRRMNVNRYVCGKCRARLKLMNQNG